MIDDTRLRRIRPLLRLALKPVTINDVLNAGDGAIEAAGLNPYCVNEGLANGDEEIDVVEILIDTLDA